MATRDQDRVRQSDYVKDALGVGVSQSESKWLRSASTAIVLGIIRAQPMPGFNFGIVGDAGNYRTNGSRFYYSPGGAWNGNKNVNSIGPGQAAIAELVQEFKITDLISAGDLTYTTGASTLIDEANGQFYYNFMAPYPSPRFTKAPYRQGLLKVRPRRPSL